MGSGIHVLGRKVATEGFEDYERAVRKSILHDNQNEVMFRINIPVGAEIDEVVRNITFQIKERSVGNGRLPGLPEQMVVAFALG